MNISNEQYRVLNSLHMLKRMIEQPHEIEALRSDFAHEGVCSVISCILSRDEPHLQSRRSIEYWRKTRTALFTDWKHYSGSTAYPVPPTDEGVFCPEVQFHRTNNLWDGRQLELRSALVSYLIGRYQHGRIDGDLFVSPLITGHPGRQIIVSTPTSTSGGLYP